MEPSEFTNPANTVYRYEQILTRNDLILFIQLLEDAYSVIPEHPTTINEREHIITALKTATTLLDWIVMGKQRDFRGLL